MDVVRSDPADETRAAGDLYVGDAIRYRYLATPPQSEGLDICFVRFGPGERNLMHTHVYEQMLFIVSGRGIVATETEEAEVGAGDLVVVPAGEPHWHGATADSDFAHLCIERHDNRIEIVDPAFEGA